MNPNCYQQLQADILKNLKTIGYTAECGFTEDKIVKYLSCKGENRFKILEFALICINPNFKEYFASKNRAIIDYRSFIEKLGLVFSSLGLCLGKDVHLIEGLRYPPSGNEDDFKQLLLLNTIFEMACFVKKAHSISQSDSTLLENFPFYENEEENIQFKNKFLDWYILELNANKIIFHDGSSNPLDSNKNQQIKRKPSIVNFPATSFKKLNSSIINELDEELKELEDNFTNKSKKIQKQFNLNDDQINILFLKNINNKYNNSSSIINNHNIENNLINDISAIPSPYNSINKPEIINTTNNNINIIQPIIEGAINSNQHNLCKNSDQHNLCKNSDQHNLCKNSDQHNLCKNSDQHNLCKNSDQHNLCKNSDQHNLCKNSDQHNLCKNTSDQSKMINDNNRFQQHVCNIFDQFNAYNYHSTCNHDSNNCKACNYFDQQSCIFNNFHVITKRYLQCHDQMLECVCNDRLKDINNLKSLILDGLKDTRKNLESFIENQESMNKLNSIRTQILDSLENKDDCKENKSDLVNSKMIQRISKTAKTSTDILKIFKQLNNK